MPRSTSRRRYAPGRLEAACQRAEQLRSFSYHTVKNILTSSQDRLPFEDESFPNQVTPTYDNIRGGNYYAATREEQCWRSYNGMITERSTTTAKTVYY